MVARVALDRSVASGKFAFAGDRISILDATKVVEAQTARRFERRSNGSEAGLRAAMGKAAEGLQPVQGRHAGVPTLTCDGQTALPDSGTTATPT